MRTRKAILFVAALVASSAAVSAQVTVHTQNRLLAGELEVAMLNGEPVDITHSFFHPVSDLNAYPRMNPMAIFAFSDVQAISWIEHRSELLPDEFVFDSVMSLSYSDRTGVAGVAGNGHHSVEVHFFVDEPIYYTLEAAVGHSGPTGATELFLRGEGVDLSLSSDGVTSISESGILMPGDYTLSGAGMMNFAQVDGHQGEVTWTSFFNATFDFAPIPTPGAVSLLAIGAGWGARRRRRVRSPEHTRVGRS